MKSKFLIGIAGIFALSACGDAEDTTAVTQATETPAFTAPAPAESPMAVAANPQDFVNMVASSDMYELRAAELAASRGKAQAVKDFAAMMKKDHTASSAALKDAAAKAQPALVIPTAMNPAHQAQLDELTAATATFDDVYARQQVAAHEQALALLRGYTGNGSADPLAAFASKTATVVEGHLGHARALPGS